MRKFVFAPDTYHASIHHDGSSRYVRLADQLPASSDQALASPQIGDRLTIRLRTAVWAPVEHILLRYTPDGEQQFIEMQGQPAIPGSACRWWETQLTLHMPVTQYRFLIFAQDGNWWYNGAGLQRGTPTDSQDFRLLAGYQSPDWVRRSVFYQIFPDRFADGDPSSNVRDGEFEYRGQSSRSRRWGEPPTTRSPSAMVEFYGGDLAGIRQNLAYLQDLGVNALYLNPIFSAYSNHRYDVVDYEQVDAHLGGNAALAALRDATTGQGMRLMLDIVPNHCGVMHAWFQDALKDPNAPSAEFFTFTRHPDEYASWLGVRSLPKLNYRSPALREKMYSGQESIFRRWLRPPYAIDGWRLDVANMLARQGAEQLGEEIGRGIRQAVKSENPQAYILGENFFDGSAQLQGDLWDATMNYSGFAKPLWYWLTHFYIYQHAQPHYLAAQVPYSTQALVDTWQEFRASIPWVIASQQFNLLGSHDTSRILTVLGGNATLNRLAAGVLMTYPGVPCILYGDEIGLQGEGGEQARACMPWDTNQWDQELRAFYKQLIHLRRSSPALAQGGFQALLVEENRLAYLRDAEAEQIIVVAQRSPEAHANGVIPVAQGGIPDGVQFVEVFSQRRSTVSAGMLPVGAGQPGIEIWQRQA